MMITITNVNPRTTPRRINIKFFLTFFPFSLNSRNDNRERVVKPDKKGYSRVVVVVSNSEFVVVWPRSRQEHNTKKGW